MPQPDLPLSRHKCEPTDNLWRHTCFEAFNAIEDKAGNLSYRALRDPRTSAQARPDFHHRGGFILRHAAHQAHIQAHATENNT